MWSWSLVRNKYLGLDVLTLDDLVSVNSGRDVVRKLCLIFGGDSNFVRRERIGKDASPLESLPAIV